MKKITKSAKRIQAEKEIYELLDTFDPSKYNSDMYRKLFNTMSEEKFKEYMKRLASENEYISMEVDTSAKRLTLDKIFKIADKVGVKTHKYVMHKENESSDGSICSVSPHPSLILYIPVRRLQQMLSKKNSASGNMDKINPLTGTVTSDSKSASLNDTQVQGLITTNQRNTLKELIGPRADDEKSKNMMLHSIEERGEVNLKDLHLKPENKQALNTLKVFLKAINIDLQIK